MSNTYFVFKRIAIANGVLKREDIDSVKADVATTYSIQKGEPTVLIVSDSEAHLTFKCDKKGSKTKIATASIFDRL